MARTLSDLVSYAHVLVDDPPLVEDYARSLCDPWSGGAKIPLGMAVKSNQTSLVYRLPVTILGTALNIAGSAFTLTTAGTTVSFWFNPNQFDAAALLSFSATQGGATHFATWTAIASSKGFSTQMASYRLVSAGLRFIYTGADLYAKGMCFSGITNARGSNDYGSGVAGFSNFITDPDTILTPLATGRLFSHCYSPIDLDSMSFISTAITDANMYDWSVFCSFDGYDSVNGFSGYLDLAVNYETIPYGIYEQLLGPTTNPGGTQQDVKRAIDKSKEKENLKPEPHRPTEELSKEALDWLRKYGRVLPFP